MIVPRFVYARMRLNFNGAAFSVGQECTVLVREIHRHSNGVCWPEDDMDGRTDIIFSRGVLRDDTQYRVTLDLPFAMATHLVNAAGFHKSAEGEILNLTDAGLEIHKKGFATKTGYFANWQRPKTRSEPEDPTVFI